MQTSAGIRIIAMQTEAYKGGRNPRPCGNTAIVLAAALLALISGKAFADEGDAEAAAAADAPAASHLSEALRSSIGKVVVLSGRSPVNQATTGSYEKETKGLLEGAVSGSQIGKGVGTEVGPVSMRIPIPILTWPGAIVGGIIGMTKGEVQDFRDALTEDLGKAASQPLGNDSLASQVFWRLKRVPGIDLKLLAATTPIPKDTDAILYVSLTDVTIDVQGKDAIISTTARATLRRLSDGVDIYDNPIHYEDRDTLGNWTRDDNALWGTYKNFARHYFGREISAETFDRVELNHGLQPKPTKSVKRVKRDDWQGVSKMLRPTLAWELSLLGGDAYGAWAGELTEADIDYDFEIYDDRRLVYAAKKVAESTHTLDVELEACKSYRWSVRPSYRVDGSRRFGEWMRRDADAYRGAAMVGRKISDAPAYTQDFATLKIKCGSK